MTGSVATNNDAVHLTASLEKNLSICGELTPAERLSFEVEPSTPTTRVATTLTFPIIAYHCWNVRYICQWLPLHL